MLDSPHLLSKPFEVKIETVLWPNRFSIWDGGGGTDGKEICAGKIRNDGLSSL
jgi:hypothetical protein